MNSLEIPGSFFFRIRKTTRLCEHRIDYPSSFENQADLISCTTELGAFAKLEPEFAKRGVKLIGLSANTIKSHGGWIKDIDEISGSKLRFPIIGDKQRKVALMYDM